MTDARSLPLSADPNRPMTTAGLQAKVTLRRVWFEAHPNQPMPEGRDEVERLFAAIEADAARASTPDPGLRAAVENVAAAFDWLHEHYPKAFVEMPNELFRTFGVLSALLAATPAAVYVRDAARASTPDTREHPGEDHSWSDLTCTVCGRPGAINVSIVSRYGEPAAALRHTPATDPA